jgi:hypothetical protein
VQVKAYAEKYDLRYYNFLEHIDEIGLDYMTDTYDQGFHLNLSGAEKLASYFGRILVDELDLKSHHGEAEYEQIWTTLTKQYYQIKETQERLLAENGKLTGFTGIE